MEMDAILEANMKKLTKQQLEDKRRLLKRIIDAQNELTVAVEKANETLVAAKERVEAATEKLNDVISDANEFRDNVAGEQDAYFQDKSEEWQESDAGQDYQSWMECWQEELEVVEVELPEEIEVPEVTSSDVFEQLTEQPDETA